jgi:hypothetical protein
LNLHEANTTKINTSQQFCVDEDYGVAKETELVSDIMSFLDDNGYANKSDHNSINDMIGMMVNRSC